MKSSKRHGVTRAEHDRSRVASLRSRQLAGQIGLKETAELNALLALPRRRFTEITTTAGAQTAVAPRPSFEAADTGAAIVGAGIPGGTTITAVSSDTVVVLSASATASATVRVEVARP